MSTVKFCSLKIAEPDAPAFTERATSDMIRLSWNSLVGYAEGIRVNLISDDAFSTVRSRNISRIFTLCGKTF